MSDRINEIAAQKRREQEAADTKAAEKAAEQRRKVIQRQRDQNEISSTIDALSKKFFSWTRRHRVRPGYAYEGHVPFPKGWIIGYEKFSGGEGYQGYCENYALLMTPRGRLECLRAVSSGRLRRYTKSSNVSIAQFSLGNIEETIAGIVLRSGIPWD